ncbi:unnamed protein product, partial [Ixodes hexagonus]
MDVTRPRWLTGWTANERACLKFLYRRYAMVQVHNMDKLRRDGDAFGEMPRCRRWKVWSSVSRSLRAETGKVVSAARIEDFFWNVIGGEDDLDVIRARLDQLMDGDDTDIANALPAHHQRQDHESRRSDSSRPGHFEDAAAAQLLIPARNEGTVLACGAEYAVAAGSVAAVASTGAIQSIGNGQLVSVPYIADGQAPPYFTIFTEPSAWVRVLDTLPSLLSSVVPSSSSNNPEPVGFSACPVVAQAPCCEHVDKAVQCDIDAKDMVRMMREEHLLRMKALRLKRDAYARLLNYTGEEAPQE